MATIIQAPQQTRHQNSPQEALLMALSQGLGSFLGAKGKQLDIDRTEDRRIAALKEQREHQLTTQTNARDEKRKFENAQRLQKELEAAAAVREILNPSQQPLSAETTQVMGRNATVAGLAQASGKITSKKQTVHTFDVRSKDGVVQNVSITAPDLESAQKQVSDSNPDAASIQVTSGPPASKAGQTKLRTFVFTDSAGRKHQVNNEFLHLSDARNSARAYANETLPEGVTLRSLNLATAAQTQGEILTEVATEKAVTAGEAFKATLSDLERLVLRQIDGKPTGSASERLDEFQELWAAAGDEKYSLPKGQQDRVDNLRSDLFTQFQAENTGKVVSLEHVETGQKRDIWVGSPRFAADMTSSFASGWVLVENVGSPMGMSKRSSEKLLQETLVIDDQLVLLDGALDILRRSKGSAFLTGGQVNLAFNKFRAKLNLLPDSEKDQFLLDAEAEKSAKFTITSLIKALGGKAMTLTEITLIKGAYFDADGILVGDSPESAEAGMKHALKMGRALRRRKLAIWNAGLERDVRYEGNYGGIVMQESFPLEAFMLETPVEQMSVLQMREVLKADMHYNERLKASTGGKLRDPNAGFLTTRERENIQSRLINQAISGRQ